jgi:tripartite-type tricarboxylate transporter receptor subunit TctC
MAPGVPQDRVNAIRRAYTKSYTDPGLQEAAAKMNMDIQPKTGEEVTRIVQDLLRTPKPVLARMAELVQ